MIYIIATPLNSTFDNLEFSPVLAEINEREQIYLEAVVEFKINPKPTKLSTKTINNIVKSYKGSVKDGFSAINRLEDDKDRLKSHLKDISNFTVFTESVRKIVEMEQEIDFLRGEVIYYNMRLAVWELIQRFDVMNNQKAEFMLYCFSGNDYNQRPSLW